MSYRLPPQSGEWIDRSQPLEFHFEGRCYTGFAGDMISTALAASGVRLLGRSFKYHRPRGIYSLANHDVNVLVEDRARTNIRGDVTPLWAGADLRAVNTFGGLRNDWVRFSDRFSKLMPVGFYYKAFHRPRRLFPFYERRLRQLAGLGAIDPRRPRMHVPAVFDFCDVLVVGAGPAGLSAAIAAAECGAHVVVVDEQARPGGSLNYQWTGHTEAADRRRSLLERAAALPQLDLRTRTAAVGCYADHWVALVDDERLVKMRARSIVLATGAIEQPAVFGNNDLPGTMLATAAQRLVHLFAVKPFDRGVVLAANAAGYRAALDLHRAGVRVEAVLDLRPDGEPSDLADTVRQAGVSVCAGHTVAKAIPGPGKRGIEGVLACPLDERGQPDKARAIRLEADGLAMSVGWAPADGLFYQAGGRMSWSEQVQQFVPASAPPGVFAAGRLNAVYSLDDQVADGRRQGLAAARHLGLDAGPPVTEPSRPHVSPSHPYPVFPDAEAKSFVDLDEDVHYRDIVNSAQEGFDQVELLKRYSTFGMGPSQGKLANQNSVRILAHIKGQSVAETGVTKARPFLHPVPLAHLAGRSFHPHRQTPLDSRHEAAGAVFIPAGDWRRPAYYTLARKPAEAVIAEEVLAVRQQAGLIDVGTLGKIEINGPGAGAFIDRLYTGRFANMSPGTTRYGLMCDESGVIIDDGLIARLADDRFYLTTTTSGSAAVYRELQRWALVWGSDVVLTNATGHYAAINLAGPRASAILRSLCDCDVSAAALPYLSVREARVADVPARLLRVGFVGEWGCEIHIPAHSAARVWDAIVEAGRTCGIRPFGVEAQRILRLEKGHVIVSQDTDGLTTPLEANMAWAIKSGKPFFIGQRSLEIMRRKPLARLLVGFLLDEPVAQVPRECHLVIEGDQIVGRVTSISRSPTLTRVLGLAFLPPALATVGQPFRIRTDDGTRIGATVAATPFYDPKNLRQTETIQA